MDDDDLLLHNITSQHQLEIDDDREFLDQVRLLAAVLIVGSNEDHAWSVENRRPRRQYLGRMNLLPNPRVGTPWTRLYENHEDRAFITTMGVDTSTFHAILEAGFERFWWCRMHADRGFQMNEAVGRPARAFARSQRHGG